MSQSLQFVTTFSAEGFQVYGGRMVSSMREHGLGPLVVYSEDRLPPLPKGTEFRDALAIEGFSDFLERHRDNPIAHGNVVHPSWRKKERAEGHSFRTDAYKFFRKPLVILDAARRLEAESDKERILIWLDGDTYAVATPPPTWFQDVIYKNADVAYLGRRGYHSECGFLAFRIPAATDFIQAWADWYLRDVFLDFESHDSKLFDDTRQAREWPLRFRNLSPKNGDHGHVFHRSVLRLYFRHLKGREKYLAVDRDKMVSRR
jgi:hypothetical protein